jgi:hypothetical protein
MEGASLACAFSAAPGAGGVISIVLVVTASVGARAAVLACGASRFSQVQTPYSDRGAIDQAVEKASEILK